MISASRNRGSENVGIFSIVVAERKLRDVERQIFAADLVIAAHDTALNQRPETIIATEDVTAVTDVTALSYTLLRPIYMLPLYVSFTGYIGYTSYK